ncbi:hypothetical protein ACHWQZ_G009487 [Mnemiopsis leidyi]
MEGASKVTQQIEAHLAAFGQKCEIGKSHFEAALLLRDHEQLEAGALRTYATASQLLKTAEQLVKAGNVDRERVRDTTKRLDTLWQGLTSRLNTHKEALSYSVTFHQKLEQVKAWLTNWQAAIEQQQSRLASQELLVQLQRQGEVLTELYNGLQQDSKHLIKLLASNKQYSTAERHVTAHLSHVTSHYNATCGMWQVYRAAHTTSTKIRKLEQQGYKLRSYLETLESEFMTPFYDITTSLEVIKGRLKKLEELDRRLDPLLSDIDGLKCSASKLLAEGNENAINIVAEVNNHWAVFKLKKQQCEQYLLFTTHLYTQIRDVDTNIRSLRQLIKVHKAKATNATYNEFQALKSGVLQQSNEIVRQSETMLELIRLMKETCLPGILDKPAKHIMTVIEKFKGADAVVRELRLQKVERRKEEIESWIDEIGEPFLREHIDTGSSLEETEKYCNEFTTFLDEVSGVKEKVETLNEETLLVTWSDFNTRLASKHDQILVAKQFFLTVDEYHNRFKQSQDSLTVDQLPDDVIGTDTMLIQCKTEPQQLQQLYDKVDDVFGRITTLLSNQPESVLRSRVIHMRDIMSKLQGLHDDIKSSWKDREQKLNKGLELRKFEQGIKNLYLWISDEGESFIRSHNFFSTSSASLTATFAEFNSFQRQMAVEQSRLMELEMSCTSLKDCIIFDNGAIDTRMSAARNSWDVFNEKFGLRKKLLQILVEDIIPPMDQYRERLKYWRGECDKSKSELTNVHVTLLKTLQSQITEERRRVPHIIKDKAYSTLASENSYLDKFVRNIQEDLDAMLQESREIDSLLLSRTTSINSLNSVTSSGSVSSDSKMSITSDEGCSRSRQPQAKLPNGNVPTGKPPPHYNRHQSAESQPSVSKKMSGQRPDSINSDSGIIGSSGSDTSQSRWSWPEDSKPATQPTDKATGDDKKLRLVVEELIKSEHDFVSGLNFIVRQYTAHLMKHRLWTVSQTLLGNVEDIFKFHRELFLPDLLQCGGDPIKVAAVFLKYRAKYDLHVQYCVNKPKSESVYSEHEQELEEVQKVLDQNFSLSSFLIKPVQRITKYQLLLAEILKFGKSCNLQNLDQVEEAYNVMMEVPRKANNLMHLEMFEDPPDDTLVHQDSLSVINGSAWIQGQGKQRQVFLFKHSLVLAKHELEGKKLKSYSTKNVIDLVNASLVAEEDSCRFSVSTNSTKFCFCADSQAKKQEWAKLVKDGIEYCSKDKDRGSLGSNNSNDDNKKGINQKIRSSLRFHKRRKSLTKISLKEDDIIKESEQSDWAQPYITSNRIPTDDILRDKTEKNYDRCISKLSNISMSIDHINLIVPNDHPTSTAEPSSPSPFTKTVAQPPPSSQNLQSGYKFTDILFYGHFSMFCTCEHQRTGLKFTAQVTPVVDRQFYRSIQREVEILQQLNYKRVSRLHEVLLQYDNCIVLVMSYQYQLPLMDFLLLKETHKEHETIEIIKNILEGLCYLHARSIAHLDLKPENFIWDKTTVKIINYELAHYVDEENVFLEPSMLDGEFAAPELLQGRVSTTAADIWSVGVLTYLLLYSDSPFYLQGQIIPPQMRAFHNTPGNSVLGDNTLVFLSSLLQNDPRRRLNGQGCLNSTWIKSSSSRSSGVFLDKGRLRKFYQRRRHEAASMSSSRVVDIPDSVLDSLGLSYDML